MTEICLIGDYIVDRYQMGTCSRLSPEAPVPVILNPEIVDTDGGVGNVAANLNALGSTFFITYDEEHVSRKTRVVANGHIVARIDEETYHAWMPQVDYSQFKYVVMSDYDKGVCHHSQEIIDQANRAGCKVFVDAKKPLDAYNNAFLVKMNEELYIKNANRYADDMWHECEVLCQRHNIENLVVTMGEKGIYIYCAQYKGGGYMDIAEKRHVSDVTGAGDVVLAVLVHFYSRGTPLPVAVKYANALAGISVEHFGTYVLTQKDIRSVVNQTKTIFTNGCFDLLHAGHIHLLKEARKLGDKLIVGLNSDKSVKFLKGEDRPVVPEQMRKAVLEQFDFVDEVILFDEQDPRLLIEKIRPDIIVKGGDYEVKDVVTDGRAQIHIVDLLPGYSTTGIINAK